MAEFTRVNLARGDENSPRSAGRLVHERFRTGRQQYDLVIRRTLSTRFESAFDA
jgi:hypothetical protein